MAVHQVASCLRTYNSYERDFVSHEPKNPAARKAVVQVGAAGLNYPIAEDCRFSLAVSCLLVLAHLQVALSF